MKTNTLNLLSTIFLLAFSLSSISQIQNCTPPTGHKELDVNNVRALIQNGGDMWWDLVGQAKYEVPKNSGRNAFFTQSLWIGGTIVGTGNLGMAAIKYRQNGVDYFPGPLDTNGVTIDTTCTKFNRIFAVYKSEIEQHIIGGQTSQSVLEWPGRGNPANQMPLQDLAPFIDVNGDNIYNALDGDYPDIKGDKALWYVFNDYGNLHSESGGNFMGIEVQVMAYAYATDDVLNNTTFYDYKIMNKNKSMTNTYIGLFTDVDLGNPFDDFIACDSSRNLGIGYNSDIMDEDNGGALGYGANPPVVGVRTVKIPTKGNGMATPMSGFMYFNNDMSVTGDPQLPLEYYNYLQNVWRDGTHLVQGGTGHINDPDANPNIPVNYAYVGVPADNNTWSECGANNTGGDRRFLMNYGAFDFNKGETITFTVATIFTRDGNAPSACSENFTLIKQSSDSVKAFADSTADCSGFNPIYQAQVTDTPFGTQQGKIEISFFADLPDLRWSTGDTTTSITGLDTGNYSLLMSNGLNCYITLDFYVGNIVSVPEVFAKSNLKMFPNPAQNQITVSHKLTGQTNGAILDLSGREIRKFSLSSPRTVISTADIVPGTYLVRIENGGNEIYLKLIIMK